MKQLIIFCSLMLFSFSAFSQASAGLRLLDGLLSSQQVTRLLINNGIDSVSAEGVQNSVMISWRALSGGEVPTSPAQAQNLLRSLNISDPQDQALRNQLNSLLMRPLDEISGDDLTLAINNLIYLANRHGQNNAAVLACSSCVNPGLRNSGVNNVFQTITNPQTLNILENIIPQNPRALQNFISSRMRSLNWGDFSRAPRNLVPPEKERSLAVFIAMAEHGTQRQQEFVRAVIAVSTTPDGETILLNPRNPHRLWALFSQEDMSDETLSGWIRILREVAEEGSEEVSKEDAFFRVLARQAEGDPAAIAAKRAMREQNCFFRN